MPGDAPPKTEREKLEAVAAGYTALMAMRDKQDALIVDMIRFCISRVESPDAVKRQDGIKALGALAAQLEKNR